MQNYCTSFVHPNNVTIGILKYSLKMERRNLPRKARDIKRDHSDDDDFESPVVKKKPTKKQAGKTDAKSKLVTKTLKNNINNDDDDDEDKIPQVPKKRGKTQSAKLTATEDKIAEENVPQDVRGSGKKAKLIVGKEDTDAPATKKKKLPSKEVDVDIPALKKKGISSKGKDEVPLKVLIVETPDSGISAPTKKKMNSKVKKDSASKESDVDDKSDDIPASKVKKVAKSKKESASVESDNDIPAVKKIKKPLKGKLESVPEESDAVEIDSEISAPIKKKVPSKGKKEIIPKESDELKTTEKGIKKLQNSIETNYANIDFNINEASNTKICSFNVAGVRAFVKKGGQEYFEKERPDIICLQVINTNIYCSMKK